MSAEFSFERRWHNNTELPPTSLTFNGRPLVVIDPEDREQVERLVRAAYPFGVRRGAASGPEALITPMQAALREFANPRPVTVFEHYVQRPADASGEVVRSICGKVWRPSSDTVSGGRCPDCIALIESGWAK